MVYFRNIPTRGDVRADGKIYWKTYKGRDLWLSKACFAARLAGEKSGGKVYRKVRKQYDSSYAFVLSMRNSLRKKTKRKMLFTSNSSVDIIGCSWNELQRHIERQFLEGMGWHNRSLWHIDHIIPLSSAHDEYSLAMLWHFTNLRPIWVKDNLIKSNKWNPPEYCI